MKLTKYFTQFQMQQQRGKFCGINTCSLTNFGRHDFTSFLLAQTESYTTAHRPDINSLLSQQVQEKQLAPYIVNAKREEAKAQNTGVDFDSSIKGATYVPLNIAIKFEQALQKNIQSATAIVDNRANAEQEYTLKFKKSWPLCLHPCQNTDKYGAIFATIPKFRLSSNYFLG